MRLSTIKLAGFKSFVDPTTLHLPENMVGIVGPNGCGKSNIIDAIRWVMGESAASRLRGDSITDVIFSGSSARKSVGQATVELIFDNSDHTVQGEYAQFNEISVKRQVSRDGQSSYYLNGTRCRRRDITDLFLGTGLGPRSYSIIEQGMISQIIEAHPEDLRNHLEEAAGISKYKERRRETESRIQATRENLDRLRDVRDEVDKQLEHLNRQARAAERWKALKEEQLRKEAELRVLEYRVLWQQHDREIQELSAQEIAIEKKTAEQRQLEAQAESMRERHIEASEHLNQVQGEVYRVGSEIARIEQRERYNRETSERLHREKAESERELTQLSGQLTSDRQQLAVLSQALIEGEPKLEILQQWQEQTLETQHRAEAVLTDWQQHWDTHTRDAGEVSRAGEVERTRLGLLDRQSLDLMKRHEALTQERNGIDPAELEATAARLEAEHEQQRECLEMLTETLEQHKQSHMSAQEEERAVQMHLNEARQQFQTVRGRLASLEALQHAALGQDHRSAQAWLRSRDLADAARLGEVLDVDAGWETAVETVLTGLFDGVLVDDPQQLATEFAALHDADLVLLRPEHAVEVLAGSLATHVRGPAVVLRWLSQVRVAETLAQAASMAATLSAEQSVITPQGEWLGLDWARVRRSKGNQQGVLAREREMRSLRESMGVLEQDIAMHSQRIETLHLHKLESERARDAVQRELYQVHRRQSELAGQLHSQRGQLETVRGRAARLAEELAGLQEQMEELRLQTHETRGRLEQTVSHMGDLEDRRRALEHERRGLLEAREEARMNAREATEQAHALALSLESRRAALTSLQPTLARLEAQLRQLERRHQDIVAQLDAAVAPMTELEAERQQHLEQRLVLDKQLIGARRAMEEGEEMLRHLDQQRQRIEQEQLVLREALTEKRLAAQALELRAKQLAEAIEAAGLSPQQLLRELPEEADATRWRTDLEQLLPKIARLEPVNLAAIQEYEEQSQRKQYLDAQLIDLSSAMDTLENAIRKIDRETRQRFKETFDQVNAGIQALFPRLFGGGHAYLELTGEDLLSTGVSIMARPPGKRVSNITLLSGGEKALTAVALVFSIFQLNPAPFCLLDEVDAPLDEANVVRFSHMVAEMSARVQFLFVTHNKATMGAASQLCGVTMREPGVSRLVQVDLAEAAKLVGAA